MVVIKNAEAMAREAADYVARLTPYSGGSTILALSGELGAGKTTFVQAIAKALGVEETVTSPTFVIEKIYQLEDQKWRRLIHIDAYRLKSAHELEMLGWKELLADSGNLIIIEWPEKVSEAIPNDAIRARFDIAGERRIIAIDGGSERQN
jgi:tRNA threonylcarbamoyladenosine biosynthesis protein TsaE